MDRFVATSHFPLSGLKWCSVLQKENKRCYVLPSPFLLINILILSLRIGFFLLYSVCRVLPCKEVLQINMNFILLKWYMSTNVSSGESAHFLSYINEPALEFVYSWAGEWLLTLNNTLRMSEKNMENQTIGHEKLGMMMGQSKRSCISASSSTKPHSFLVPIPHPSLRKSGKETLQKAWVQCGMLGLRTLEIWFWNIAEYWVPQSTRVNLHHCGVQACCVDIVYIGVYIT